MTVEATSFLSNTKISNGHEKSAKILKNHKNLIIILLVFVLLLFCILTSILQIWIYNQVNKAKAEIDQLKKDVIELKSNGLDQDLLVEIAEFNRKYNNQNDVKDQIDLDEKINLDDEKVKFDDVGDENDENDSEEDNYEGGYHSGYGEEEYDDDYDLDSFEDELTDTQQENEDDNNIYKDMTKHTRKTRSITGITKLTDQGVPIVEEPYSAVRRNRTRASPQDVNQHPKLKLTWNGQYRNLNNPRREYDRNRQHIRHHHSDHSSKFAFAAAPIHHAFESSGPKISAASVPTPIPIQTRQSRVMHFEDKSKAFRQVVGKEQLAKLKEQRLPPQQYTNFPNGRRKSYPQNMSMKKNLEMKNGRRMRVTAVHFDGDSSRLEEMRHHSFKGNGKIVLNRNEYLHWKPAEWVLSHGMDKYFHMDSTGTLTVNDHGLFLIYAQVYYSDTHDLNGYEILHNNQELYQCTTMTHMNVTKDRTNSCYTSGLIHLKSGDKIRLRDVGNHRNVLMQKSKSYFGLIKINLTPPTHSNENTDVERFDQIK